MKKIGVAVVGLGIGERHLRAYHRDARCQVRWVLDHDKVKAKNLADETGAGIASSYEAILKDEDVQIISIASFDDDHASQIIQAINAGKHVFVEKAMGIRIPDCKAMVDAQKKSGLCLQVGHQRMFDLKYLEALRRVREGEFGPITHIRTNWNGNGDWALKDIPVHMEKKLNWRIYNEFSLGLMGELASHQIQVANWFLDEIPEYVVGSGSLSYWKNSTRDSFDHVHTIFKYPSGAHLDSTVIQTNWYYGLEEAIMGPKGNFELENGRFISQTPPPPPGIKQLIADVEKKVFQTLPIGGASWVVEPKSNLLGDVILNTYPLPDSTDLQFIAFMQSIRDHKPITDIIRQGYYASVGAIMGHEAMIKRETVYFNKEWEI